MSCDASESVSFSTNSRGEWALEKRYTHVPFVYVTCVNELAGEVRALLTTDIDKVKKMLRYASQRESIKAIQLIFPCHFPDNQGVAVADVYKIEEGKTKRGEVFHSFTTRFGVQRIGGPCRLMASQVELERTVLYEKSRPQVRYWG